MKKSLDQGSESDLTIIFLTNDRLPEKWKEFHREQLLKSVGNAPIITLSREPSTLPGINLIQDQPPSKSNIFYQMLRGIRMVKTKYVAIAEDDCLMPKSHFTEFRPKDDEFAYNQHRWTWYSWSPIYSLKNYIKTNATLIAPTNLALEALEERFAKYPHDMKDIPVGMCGELGCYEKQLGVTLRKVVEWKSIEPVIQADHDFFTVHDASKESVERRHKKKHGVIQALKVSPWGKSIDLQKYFNE